MARGKRKKYPKLPNGFGSIKHLSGNRRNPYAIHPPVTEFSLNGTPKTPKAIAYVDDWYWGFSILLSYKAGTFVPGIYPPKPSNTEIKALDGLVDAVISDLSVIRQATTRKSNDTTDEPTFTEVYKRFYAWKFDENNEKQYSESTKYAIQAAYKNFSSLHDRIFKSVTVDDLQIAINACPLKYASVEAMVNFIKQLYDYAMPRNLTDKNYGEFVKINREDDNESGVPFSDKELKILWKHKNDEIVEFILIMCYSGYRISAFQQMKVDLKDLYFQGGVKNRTSKNRIVPIHSSIVPLVKRRIKRDGTLLTITNPEFRKAMYTKLESLGIEKHTPHDCRHTFSRLCEKYEVKENDKKRMMGHAFQDIDNKVYGHRDLEDLRIEIEKIKACY